MKIHREIILFCIILFCMKDSALARRVSRFTNSRLLSTKILSHKTKIRNVPLSCILVVKYQINLLLKTTIKSLKYTQNICFRNHMKHETHKNTPPALNL